MTLETANQSTTETNGTLWQNIRKEYFRRLFHPITIVATICCSILFASLGPYDTYTSQTFLFRLTFWSGVVVSSCVLSVFFGVWANLRFQHKPFWFHSAIGAILFSIVYFLLMWRTLNYVFEGRDLPHPIELFVVIVSISALVYVCMWFFSAMVNKRASEISGIHIQPATVTETAVSQGKRRNISVGQVLSEYRARLFDPVNITFCVLGSLLFAFIGLFGVFNEASFAQRFLYWSLMVWSTSIITLLFAVWANLRYATRPFWFHSGGGSTVFSVIYLLLIWITLRAIYAPLSAPTLTGFYATTLAVTSIIYLALWFFAYLVEIRILQRQASARAVEPPKAHQSPQTDSDIPCSVGRFLRMIGPDAGSKLIRLSMSDHYIEAHTDTGMHLLYMRFADAIKDLKTADGAQVHRSHWVHFNEIKSTSREGSNSFFLMSDDVRVPIARSRKKSLQDRGIL